MSPTAPYDSRAVANFLLDLANNQRLSVTQIVLYKVLYFSQGWYLASFDKPLISHEFEAWRHGPVIKVLRDQFRDFGDKPITSRAKKLDILSGKYSLVEPNLHEKDALFVTHIFGSYSHYDAWELSNLSHDLGSPWDKLWNSEKPVGRLALRIRNEDIKAHFDGLGQKRSIL